MTDDINRLLGEVVANQRNMFKEQKRVNDLLEKHFDDDIKNFGKLNTRIRGVEQKINYAAGGVAVVSGAMVIFWKAIVGTFAA